MLGNRREEGDAYSRRTVLLAATVSDQLLVLQAAWDAGLASRIATSVEVGAFCKLGLEFAPLGCARFP